MRCAISKSHLRSLQISDLNLTVAPLSYVFYIVAYVSAMTRTITPTLTQP